MAGWLADRLGGYAEPASRRDSRLSQSTWGVSLRPLRPQERATGEGRTGRADPRREKPEEGAKRNERQTERGRQDEQRERERNDG